MMNKRRTSEIGKAKYLLFAPLAGVLLMVSNIESVAREIGEQIPVVAEVQQKTEQARMLMWLWRIRWQRMLSR